MHLPAELVDRCAISWLTISARHPALPGHFPGRPVVPGVVLLEHLQERLCHYMPGCHLRAVSSVKFLRPAQPEECLLLGIEMASGPTPATHGRFTFRSGTEVLAQGTFEMAPA